MTVLLGKMARPAVALCLLVLGSYPVNGAEHLKVFTSAVPPIAQEDEARPGFAVELVKAVLREAKLDGEVVFVPWPRLLDSGGSRTGTLVFPVPRLAKVESDFTWITPLVDLDLTFVSTGQEVNSLAQALELRSILVRGQSVYEYMLRDYGFGNVEPVSSGNIPLMLAKGRADAWFTTTDEARWAWSTGQTAVPLDVPLKLGKVMGQQRMWLAGSKGLDRGIAERIARAIAAMREDGRFNAIMAAYLPPRTTTANAAVHVAAVKNRLAAAQGPTDSSAKPLTKRYAIQKTKLGSGNRRNLMMTGDMLRNFQVRTLTNNRAKASNSTRKNRLKAWLNQKIEPWVVFSPKNQAAVAESARRVLQEMRPKLLMERAFGGR